MPEEALAFLRVGAFVGGLASVYALAHRWRRVVVSLAGFAALVGVVLLGWAALQGVWAEPGRLHAASPEAEVAFRVGFLLTVLGSSVFIVALPPPHPSWGSGSTRGIVSDISSGWARPGPYAS
jgi:hypothetical protein